MAWPALKFGNATSDYVSIGSAASLDNIRIGAILTWFYVDTYTTTKRIYGKSVNLNNKQDLTLLTITAQPGMQFLLGRATSLLASACLLSSFPVYADGKWVCHAVLWNADGAAGDQRMFMGDLYSPFVEASAYTAQGAGSGTTGDDSAAVGYIGNIAAASTFSFTGRIAIQHIVRDNYPLTDLNRWRAASLTANPLRLPNTVFAGHLGLNGTSVVVDESGLGNHGAISGPSQSSITLPQTVVPMDGTVFSPRLMTV